MNIGELRDGLAVFNDERDVTFITSQGIERVEGIEQDLLGNVALVTRTGKVRLWGIIEAAHDNN